MNALESSSTRPYLLRALYEWCTDNGFTPYVAVAVDDTVQVPREYVKDGEIVLNISYDATSALQIGNEFIEFKARFSGIPRDIMVPIGRIMAIYSRENGQGMAFPLLEPTPYLPANSMVQPPAAPVLLVEESDNRVVQLVATDDSARNAPAAKDGVRDAEPADGEDAPARPSSPGDEASDGQEPPRPGGGRPTLTRIK